MKNKKIRFVVDGKVYYAFNKRKFYFTEVWIYGVSRKKQFKIERGFVKEIINKEEKNSEFELYFEPQVGSFECWVISF